MSINRSRRRCASTIISSPRPGPTTSKTGALNPELGSRPCAARVWSRRWPVPNHGSRFQFERQGFFYVDEPKLVAVAARCSTVGLRDTWAKIESKG